MSAVKLRAVQPDDEPTPEQLKAQWLFMSAEIRALEQRAFQLRSQRQAIKADIMRNMRLWGVSDELLTGILGEQA